MPANEEDRRPKHHHHMDNCEEEMPHVHTYLTEADVADGHQHIIMGVSGPARERGRIHCHRIHGRTSYICEEGEGGHWHTQDVMTGPAIEMPEGNHVHYFAGMTSKDDGHCHSFAGATGLGPSLPCMEEDDYDDCDDDFEDECHEEIECEEEEIEEECEMPMPVKMPKYKHKFGKRLGEIK